MESEEERPAEDERIDGERGRNLLATVDFGLRVREFLDGPIGQRLVHDAEVERAELLEELLACDPDTEEGRSVARGLRLRIGILDHWQDMFAKYLVDGEQAEGELQQWG